MHQRKVKKSKVNQIKEESIIDDYVSVTAVSINKNNDAIASPSSRFIKPTVQDIKAYCFERQNSVVAEVFFDFYESKNWMIGKSKMKDWRAAVRTWERRQTEEKKEQINNPFLRKVIEMDEQDRCSKNVNGFINGIS